MQMPGRTYNTTDYRYGFNGMEKDKEIKGDGNSYTTEFRQYDPRLGRWLSLDPLMSQFPWMSPYVAFDNNPVFYNDPLGLAAESANGVGKKKVKEAGDKTPRRNPLTHKKWKEGEDWVNKKGELFIHDGKQLVKQKCFELEEVTCTAKRKSAPIDIGATIEKALEPLINPAGDGISPIALRPIGYMNPQCQPMNYLTPREGGHLLLDGVGMIPVVGEFADGANAIWYATEGNYSDAGISLLGTIPIGGQLATGARMVVKLSDEVVTAVRGADEIVEGIAHVGDDVIGQGMIEKVDRSLLDPPSKFGEAPKFKNDGTSVEIHHVDQNPNGPFREMHWEAHRGKGNYKANHPHSAKKSGIDRDKFNAQKKAYWKNQFPKE